MRTQPVAPSGVETRAQASWTSWTMTRVPNGSVETTFASGFGASRRGDPTFACTARPSPTFTSA